MVLDSEKDHPSRWAAVTSIAGKIGCSGCTLLEWVDWFNNRRLLEPIGNIPPAEAVLLAVGGVAHYGAFNRARPMIATWRPGPPTPASLRP